MFHSEAEVDQLDVFQVISYHDVIRLNISVDDILLVAVVQGLGNFVNVVCNDILKEHIVAAYSLQQTSSVDVFSHDKYFLTLFLIDFMEL